MLKIEQMFNHVQNIFDIIFLFKRSGKGALLSLKDTRAQNLIEFIHTSNKICCIQVLQSAIQWIASILTMKSVASKYCKFQLNGLHPYNQWNLLHPSIAICNSQYSIKYDQIDDYRGKNRSCPELNELEWSWMSTDSDWS